MSYFKILLHIVLWLLIVECYANPIIPNHHIFTNVTEPKIGDYYQGGVVFYLDNSIEPKKGLIVALTDADYTLSPLCSKGPTNDVYELPYGACFWSLNYTGIGTTAFEHFKGQENTSLALSLDATPTGYPAVYIAHQYKTQEDPSDAYWYLPTQAELISLWNVANQINKTIIAYGGQPLPLNLDLKSKLLTQYPYWSSTEFATSAWVLFFGNGLLSWYFYKDTFKFAVRSVRTFTY